MTFLGIGPGELIMIVILALVVVGPDRLPVMARQAGRLLVTIRNWMQSSPDAALVLRARQEIEQELASLRSELLEVQNVRNEVLGVAKQIDEAVSPIKSARLDQVSDLLKPDTKAAETKTATAETESKPEATEQISEKTDIAEAATEDTSPTLADLATDPMTSESELLSTSDEEHRIAPDLPNTATATPNDNPAKSLIKPPSQPTIAAGELIEEVEEAEEAVAESAAAETTPAPAAQTATNPALSLIKPPAQPTVAAGDLDEEEEQTAEEAPIEASEQAAKPAAASHEELDSLFALDEPAQALAEATVLGSVAEPQAETLEPTTPSGEISNAALLEQMQLLTKQMQSMMSDMAALQAQLTERGILDPSWNASAQSAASEEDRQ